MSSSAENPYASPESVPEHCNRPDTGGTFAGVLRAPWTARQSLFKFYIGEGHLLAAPLNWPVPGRRWMMQLLPLVAFGLVGAFSWLWEPAAPYLVFCFLVMLVLWLCVMTFLLLKGERQTRDQAALYDVAPRNLESFLDIDGRSFVVRTSDVRSFEVAPRNQWRNTGRVAGSVTFDLQLTTNWTMPLRILVVGPYDITAIRDELVTAGFPIRS